MKIDFQYVFRFLHDSWRGRRANTGRERQPFRPRTSLELQQSEVMVLIAQSFGPWDTDSKQQMTLRRTTSRVVSSPSTQTTAPLKTCLSKSWNVQMTWLMSLHTDVGLNSCPCGVIRTILSWICSEMWRLQLEPFSTIPPSPQGAGTPSTTVTDNSIYTHCWATAVFSPTVGVATKKILPITELISEEKSKLDAKTLLNFSGGGVFHKVSYFQTVETYSSCQLWISEHLQWNIIKMALKT